MTMWVEYLILAAPSAFPWFYLVRQNSLSSINIISLDSNKIIFVERLLLR